MRIIRRDKSAGGSPTGWRIFIRTEDGPAAPFFILSRVQLHRQQPLRPLAFFFSLCFLLQHELSPCAAYVGLRRRFYARLPFSFSRYRNRYEIFADAPPPS